MVTPKVKGNTLLFVIKPIRMIIEIFSKFQNHIFEIPYFLITVLLLESDQNILKIPIMLQARVLIPLMLVAGMSTTVHQPNMN